MDSTNPLHLEWMQVQKQENQGFAQVIIDMSGKLSEEQREQIEELVDIAGLDYKKVCLKSRPTFLIKSQSRLIPAKLSNSKLIEQNASVIRRAIEADFNVREIKSLAALCRVISRQNVKMDDCTIVYFDESKAIDDLALAFVQNETSNPVLRVTDSALARQIGLQPDKFYCYYKPSFANKTEQCTQKLEQAMIGEDVTEE
jgi:hypothetical protein